MTERTGSHCLLYCLRVAAFSIALLCLLLGLTSRAFFFSCSHSFCVTMKDFPHRHEDANDDERKARESNVLLRCFERELRIDVDDDDGVRVRIERVALVGVGKRRRFVMVVVSKAL
ncbi:unnamed protein product [Periconia digitata]|uniref:Uncharacterized protein n=1 Tax=Periconia digitata TaxID=1303443 RepID=A0A9W4UA87_9PLEO|nr:unnamed protein product [Periconia digitata]